MADRPTRVRAAGYDATASLVATMRDTAVDAKDDAETAQAAAESAQSGAASSASAASSSASSAASSASAAASSATAAEAARDLASEIAIGDADAALAGAILNEASDTYSALSASVESSVATYIMSEFGSEELLDLLGGDGILIPKPAGMGTFVRSFNIARVGNRRYSTTYDPAEDRPSTGVQYYAAPSGTGDGTTPATPCTLRQAHQKSDVGTIHVAAGTYWHGDDLAQITKSLNIIGAPADPFTGDPTAILTGWVNPSTLTWTLESGNVYKTTISTGNVQNVADSRPQYATAWNDKPLYTRVADLGSITLPGQYAISGTTLYVRAMGNANLSTDASFMRVSKDGRFNGVWCDSAGARLYVENLAFEGNSWGVSGYGSIFASSNVASLVVKDCRIRYSSAAGINGAPDWAAIIGCRLSSCRGDGISWDPGPAGTQFCDALEVDCDSRHHSNAYGVSTFNINAYTSHRATTRVIRVNCTGSHTYGPVFADVLGAKTWNLGCDARDSDSPDGTQDAGFQVLSATGWYDRCDASGNDMGFNAGASAIMYVRDRGPGINTNALFETDDGQIVDYSGAPLV